VYKTEDSRGLTGGATASFSAGEGVLVANIEQATTARITHYPTRRHANPLSRALSSRRLLRAFDLVVVILALPFIALVGAVMAVAIFLDSPGPVLYRCTRVGRGGRRFTMLKFRKMRRDVTGSALTIRKDARFTPIGAFLCNSRLDELPQVWNVLKGDMRLVGPRPETVAFVEHYPEAYRRILAVRPGLTGLAQLEFAGESHILGETEDPIGFYHEQLMPRKIELDLAYVDRRTAHGDVGILLRTAWLPIRTLASKIRSGVRRAGGPHVLAYGLSGLALAALFMAVAGPSS
jgi:lipopolysaccharide/colanic/teichoic acid biosynthesis glycosyltransferase